MRIRTRRGPSISPSQPLGTSNAAYATLKEASVRLGWHVFYAAGQYIGLHGVGSVFLGSLAVCLVEDLAGITAIVDCDQLVARQGNGRDAPGLDGDGSINPDLTVDDHGGLDH